MYNDDAFAVHSKAGVPGKSRESWNPGKTDFWVERQFGVLATHSPSAEELDRAGPAILGLDQRAADQPRPKLLYAEVMR